MHTIGETWETCQDTQLLEAYLRAETLPSPRHCILEEKNRGKCIKLHKTWTLGRNGLHVVACTAKLVVLVTVSVTDWNEVWQLSQLNSQKLKWQTTWEDVNKTMCTFSLLINPCNFAWMEIDKLLILLSTARTKCMYHTPTGCFSSLALFVYTVLIVCAN